MISQGTCSVKRLILFVAAGLLAACSKGFQAYQNEALQESSGLSSQSRQSDFNLQSQFGSLSWTGVNGADAQVSAVNNQKVFEVKIAVPYGALYKQISKMIQAGAPYACQLVPDVLVSPAAQYNSHETPCGAIVDENWKQLTAIDFDGISGSSGGYSYSLTGARLPIFLSRQTRSASYREQDLTSGQLLSKQSSSSFMQDISIRYSPNNTGAQFDICMNLPGGKVSSSQAYVEGKMWKKIWGVKVSYSSGFDVWPGEVSFDYVRGCFSASLNWASGESSPRVSLSIVEPPRIFQATYSGFKIKIRDFFLNLADNILSIFKLSIRKATERSVVSSGNELLDSEVESGAWLAKIYAEDTLSKIGLRVSKKIEKTFRRLGAFKSTEDFKHFLVDTCRVKKLSGDTTWNARFEEFCSDVVSRIKVEVVPFALNLEEQKKGCYSGFASLHESSGKWWESGCHFESEFRLVLQTGDLDYQEELKDLIRLRWSDSFIPQHWKDILQNSRVDVLTLLETLELAESIGFKQVSANQLEQLLQQQINF